MSFDKVAEKISDTNLLLAEGTPNNKTLADVQGNQQRESSVTETASVFLHGN